MPASKELLEFMKRTSAKLVLEASVSREKEQGFNRSTYYFEVSADFSRNIAAGFTVVDFTVFEKDDFSKKRYELFTKREIHFDYSSN